MALIHLLKKDSKLMCRCFEEIAEPSLKKKSGSKPEYSFFDSFFSVLSEKPINSFPMLMSSCPGTQATRRQKGQPPGVFRVKAGDVRQGCIPSGQPPLSGTENTREILAIPATAQLHSQRCCC